MIAAGARNNNGVMGIAFGATVLMARADTPGSCASTSGCSFDDANIAAGIDHAVTHGAKVINLSLGGGAPNSAILAAVGRAATAGAVIVVASGNDGVTDPDQFASGIRAAGNGNVIIVGSVDNTSTISSFSNRAGTQSAYFLSALGEQLCCAYSGGNILVTTNGSGVSFNTVYSGTSYATPQVAGAVALLLEAFPTLTAVQAVNLLLNNARDVGVAGTDVIYGRGILDIAAAFAPTAKVVLAGSTTQVAVNNSGVVTSPAMGDAISAASLGTVMIDSYGRAYHINLANNARIAQLVQKLTNALTNQQHNVALGGERLSLAFTVDARGRASALPWVGALRLSRDDADAARVLAARIVANLSPRTSLALAFAEGSEGLVAHLQGQERQAFLIADNPLADAGFARGAATSFALRRAFGSWGLTASAERAEAVPGATWQQGGKADALAARAGTYRFGLAVDRRFGAVDAAFSASVLSETQSVLGARFADTFGAHGADTLFLDASLGWHPGANWLLSAAWRQGFTRPRASGLIEGSSQIISNGWAIDASHYGVILPGDALSLRVSQPLRVSGGGLNVALPISYSYATGLAEMGTRSLSLAPTGREIDAELGWHAPLFGGSGSASVFWRREPGHFAGLPDDKGLGLSWQGGF